jgi:hypothetical protein
MIFNPDSEFMKIADRSPKDWQRMRSHARAGSNLGLNIKKPDTENGKVIIFNGIDGVRKVARPMLMSNTKHIHLSGSAISPAQSPFFVSSSEIVGL